MKIRFLKSAMSDMLEIKQYISIDNPIAAKRLIKKFKEKTSSSGNILSVEEYYQKLKSLIYVI